MSSISIRIRSIFTALWTSPPASMRNVRPLSESLHRVTNEASLSANPLPVYPGLSSKYILLDRQNRISRSIIPSAPDLVDGSWTVALSGLLVNQKLEVGFPGAYHFCVRFLLFGIFF